MSELMKRSITGLILIAVMVTSVIAGAWIFVFTVLLLNIFCVNEFYRLFQSLSPRKTWGIFVSTGLFVSVMLFTLNIFTWQVLLLIFPLALSLFVSELYTRSERPFERLAITFLAIIYITIPALFLANLPIIPFEDKVYHTQYVLGFYFLVWSHDSGAFAIGKLFGKHALFLRITPKKTWEGSVGGAISAMIMAYLLSFFYSDLSLQNWMVIALIVTLTGTYGDFIKSLLKRSLQVKDSGTALPGHGGFLDRFDALLGSAPFVFSYVLLLH
ncbi:MAG: phosphatidate cytidylyltransferase [Bacteroidetes bacterium]|nr:MAG: phosphatidate cytidylyltransferase [Bacteroidota bacterium]